MSSGSKPAGSNRRSPVFFLIAAAAVVVPLAVLPAGTQRYDLPKFAVLALFLLAAGPVTGWEGLSGRRPWRADKYMSALVSVFLLSAVVSFWFAGDRVAAFYGHYHRLDGLMTYMMMGALFFVVVRADIRRHFDYLLVWIVVGGVLVSVLSIAEYLGFRPFGFACPHGRVMSTVGNPVFLAAYLTVTLLAAVGIAFSKSGERLSAVYGAILLIFTAVVLTGTRSAWAGSIAGLLILVARYRRRPQAVSRLSPAITLSVVLALAIALAATTGFGFEAKGKIGRAGTAFSERAALAKTALAIIAERPLTGSGPGNAGWAMQRLQSDAILKLRGSAFRDDDAHNIWLQTAASLGIPGALAFILLVSVFFHKSRRLAADDARFAVAPAAVASLLIISSFQPVDISFLWFIWLFLGLAASASGGAAGPAVERKGVIVSTAIAVTAIAAAALYISMRMIIADFAFDRGLVLRDEGRFKEAAISFAGAIGNAPHIDQYHLLLGKVLTAAFQQSGNRQELNQAILHLKKATDVGPLNSENHTELAVGYLVADQAAPGSYIRLAAAEAKRAVSLAPTSPGAYRGLGAVLIAQGQNRRALYQFKKVIALDADFPESRLWLGYAYEKLGRVDRARSAYKQALRQPGTQMEARKKLEDLDQKR